MTFPLVSVVVTTKNEASNIENCLKSIIEQDYPNIEIIVVDNSSTDQTKELAKKYTDRVFDLGPERSAQRNFGMIKKARGEYVMYIDADMLLSKSLISECIKATYTSNFVGLYIPEVILGKSLFAKIRSFERSFYDGTVIDATRFFRRSTIVDLGGFDEELFRSGSGEDWDLDISLSEKGPLGLLKNTGGDFLDYGFAAKFASERGFYTERFLGIYHNESEDTLIPYLKKKRYYATGFGGYKNKWVHKPEIIQKQLGFKYRLVTVFLEKGKWRKCMRKPHMYLLTVILKVLVGLVSLDKL